MQQAEGIVSEKFKIIFMKYICGNFDFPVIINPYYAVNKINQDSYNFIAVSSL